MTYTPKHREYDPPKTATITPTAQTVESPPLEQVKHRVAADIPTTVPSILKKPGVVSPEIPTQFVSTEGYVNVVAARKAGVPMETITQATGLTIPEVQEAAARQLEYERTLERINTQELALKKLEPYKIDLTPSDKHRVQAQEGWDLVKAIRIGKLTETNLLDAGFNSEAIRQALQVSKALNTLAPYTRPDGISLVDAVAAGKREELRTIGVTNAQIASAAVTVAKIGYNQSIKDAEAEFLKENTTDQITISNYAGIPALTREEKLARSKQINELQKAGVENPWWEAKSLEEKQMILEYYVTLSGKQKLWGETLTKAEQAKLPGYKQAGKIIVGFVPGVGTAVYWNEMSPTWQGISIASDVLFFASALRLPKFLGKVIKMPGKQNIDDAIRYSYRVEKATQKAYAPAGTVTKYSKWIDASRNYGDNITKLLTTRKLMATRPSSVDPGDLHTIELARKAMKELRLKAIKASQEFADIQQGGLGKDFGITHVKSLENAIIRAFKGKIPTFTKLNNQYIATTKRLTEAISRADQQSIVKLQYQLVELQSKAKLAKSKELLDLVLEERILRNKIERATVEEALRLQNKLTLLHKRMAKFYADMPLQFAEPLSHGGGNVITRPYPVAPPSGGGGGVRVKGITTLSPAVSTQIIPGTYNPFQIVWVPPSVYPKITMQLKEILGSVRVITKPRPEIKPWITIPDPDDPKVKLIPVIIALPNPLAGIDAYTKDYARVQDAITEAISRTKTQPLGKTGTITNVVTTTSTGTVPGAKVVTSTSPVILPDTGTETKPDTATEVKPKIEPATSTTITTVTSTTTPETPIKTPVKIVVPPITITTTSGKVIGIKDAIAWRQGALGRKKPKSLWFVIPRPYKEIYTYLGILPKGVKVAKDAKSAYTTIQTVTGKAPPKELRIDMGIMDIVIEKPSKDPGRTGAIRFIPDIKQRTTGSLSIRKSRNYKRKRTTLKSGKAL